MKGSAENRRQEGRLKSAKIKRNRVAKKLYRFYIQELGYDAAWIAPPNLKFHDAEDVDGKGHFEMGPTKECSQSDGAAVPCVQNAGTGFDGDCAAHVDPSSLARGGQGGLGNEADEKRRWLVSVIPREGTQWPHIPEVGDDAPEVWGSNAAASLEQIILRYRLDG